VDYPVHFHVKTPCLVAKLRTMLPIASGGLAELPPGRFHVETARLKIFTPKTSVGA
jgi:hypothetical protein